MCVWIEDADAIEMESEALKIVYSNKRINAFLDGKTTLGIAGIKGQGKTFLLKVKRKKAQKDQSIVCLPKDQMVDTIDSAFEINNQLFKFLDDYINWVKAWKVSFAITIIRSEYFKDLYKEEDFEDLNEATRKLMKIENKRSSPVRVLKNVLILERKNINKVYSDISKLLDLLDRIQNGVYFFIDKIDQAFSIDIHRIFGDSNMSRGPRNASFWQYSQYALANAAYDLFSNINNHIKVYYTIREEALIDSYKIAPNSKRNIESYLITLEYSRMDLHNMFNLYIESEDDINLLYAKIKSTNQGKAFIGVSSIKHGYINNANEEVFNYIYRHSLKRPYDIMRICRQLYFLDNNEKNMLNIIRTTVNNVAKEILKTYIKELSPFLPCKYEDMKDVLRGINTNIYNLEYLKAVCKRYNTFYDGFTKCNRDFLLCNNPKPFSLFYNLGLIGVLKQSPINDSTYIEFANIGQSVFNFETQTLPESELYFLHPCLGDIVRELRNERGLNYQPNNIFVTGDLCEYQSSYSEKINHFISERIEEFEGEKVFVSSTIYDLIDERNRICNTLLDRGLYPVMSEMPFFDLSNAQLAHSHDHCIDEMLKCKNLVFILGRNYGGEYAGERYKKYAEKICKSSKDNIKRPSISLMELYIARSCKLRCYLFVSEDVEREKRNETKSKRSKKNGIDPMIFTEINFINHFKEDESEEIRGNWISTYENEEELIRRINNLTFSTAPVSKKWKDYRA